MHIIFVTISHNTCTHYLEDMLCTLHTHAHTFSSLVCSLEALKPLTVFMASSVWWADLYFYSTVHNHGRTGITISAVGGKALLLSSNLDRALHSKNEIVALMTHLSCSHVNKYYTYTVITRVGCGLFKGTFDVIVQYIYESKVWT